MKTIEEKYEKLELEHRMLREQVKEIAKAINEILKENKK